jgi:hypothetical protein
MSDWNAETAEWYAANYGEYATNRLAADALEVAPDAVIVDVGCGTGSNVQSTLEGLLPSATARPMRRRTAPPGELTPV